MLNPNLLLITCSSSQTIFPYSAIFIEKKSLGRESIVVKSESLWGKSQFMPGPSCLDQIGRLAGKVTTAGVCRRRRPEFSIAAAVLLLFAATLWLMLRILCLMTCYWHCHGHWHCQWPLTRSLQWPWPPCPTCRKSCVILPSAQCTPAQAWENKSYWCCLIAQQQLQHNTPQKRCIIDFEVMQIWRSSWFFQAKIEEDCHNFAVWA